MHRIACVTVVKNEEAHIAEWIAYQFAAGFDTVILLDNQSTDGTIAEALKFAQTHDVRIADWHEFTPDYQTRAYAYAIGRFRDQFEWLAFFDTDEFLVLDPGLDLKACLAARQDAAALAVSWSIFGSSGHDDAPNGLATEHFVYRSEAAFGPNRHVKSIVRPALVQSCINAHMFAMNGPYRDLAGRDVVWMSPGVLADPPDYRGGKLNHYFTRSWADWRAKLRRGYHDLRRDEGDFAIYNRNEVADDSAAKLAPRVKAMMAGHDNPGPANAAPCPAFALHFSQMPNPQGAQGFVLGWEGAQLGNRLSCFANLFALAERTGIPAGYAQIMTADRLIDIPDRRFYLHGNLTDDAFGQIEALAAYAEHIFKDGYQEYSRKFAGIPLQRLGDLTTESGIIVFSAYLPEFQNLALVEENIKAFCNRGNGIILAGAFWHQYMDMRLLHREGLALKNKLRLSHAGGAQHRGSVMQQAGEAILRIGIHLRLRDYRTWQGGKYYFSLAQYAALMRRIHDDLGSRPHGFCLCSDETIGPEALHGLPVWHEQGSSEDDFVALSKCHYVVGPPSSFGTWSAFLGGGKRVVLTPERMADPAALPPVLETAVQVIYPTGGYLPGDPAARPV